MSRPHPYKVQLGEQQVDLVIEGENLSINGKKQNFVVDQQGERTYHLVFNNKSYRLFIESIDKNKCTIFVNGRSHEILVKDERDQLLDRYGVADALHSIEREIRAPMPGLVLDILVAETDVVEAGGGLIVLEAMKMETSIYAERAGTIKEITAPVGTQIDAKDLLLVFA